MNISVEVCYEIKNFIFNNIDSFRADAREYGSLDLTVAVSDDGSLWNYQTGDNSYMGNAYSLPHWSVTTITDHSDCLEVYEDIIDQLEECFVD